MPAIRHIVAYVCRQLYCRRLWLFNSIRAVWTVFVGHADVLDELEMPGRREHVGRSLMLRQGVAIKPGPLG